MIRDPIEFLYVVNNSIKLGLYNEIFNYIDCSH